MKQKWKRWISCLTLCGILVSQGVQINVLGQETENISEAESVSSQNEAGNSSNQSDIGNVLNQNETGNISSQNGVGTALNQSGAGSSLIQNEIGTISNQNETESASGQGGTDNNLSQSIWKNGLFQGIAKNISTQDGAENASLQSETDDSSNADITGGSSQESETEIVSGEEGMADSSDKNKTENVSDGTAPDKNTDEIESEDVTEEYDLSRKEVRQSVTDAVYEKEIKERANLEYTDVQNLKIVNAVVVKQSLFDGNLVEDEDTIDSIMGGIEQGNEEESEKFLTQISNVVALYELSEESEYYVAFVNTMDSDRETDVREAIFALYDNEGHVLSDCIYEEETGLAYIPKEDCLNEDGEQIVLNVQVQLMQVLSQENVSSEVVTSVRENGVSVSVYESNAEIFDVETTVIAEKGLEEDNMTVAVNGVPIQEEYYAYDSETGELSLNQSAAMIQSVSVMTEENTLVEKLSELLFPANEVYALTADQMTAVAEDIELPDWVTTGTLMVGSAYYSYNDKSAWTYSYGFGSNDETLLAEMVNLIEYGGTLDMSRVTSQEDSKYITTFIDLAVNTLLNENRAVDDLQKIPILHMECCHVDSNLGSTSGSDVNGGNWSLQPVRLRFLNVDRDAGYAIIGIYTIETHTQTGCAFFKIGLSLPYGYGNIGKKDAQSDEILAGAKYSVYTDSACTIPATDVDGNVAVFTTTLTYPYSNTITFSPGTYYVKETETPSGYSLDTNVKILNIVAGERTYANNAGTATGWNYDNRQVELTLQKVSSDENLTKGNTCYSLEGAVYGVYTSTKDALSDTNRKATLTTEESGTTNTVTLDAATYYVKELEASPGYAKCTGEYDLADALGIHTVDAVDYGKTYSITCSEPVLGSSFVMQLRKWDLDTLKQEAQGSASLAGAVFQVEYFTNTNGDCSGTPAKVWFYQTDETGVVYADDTSKLLTKFQIGDAVLTGSSDLFVRTGSKEYVLPLGTYHISEVRAPAYYQLSGVMKFEGESGKGTDLSLGKTLVVKENNDAAAVYNKDALSSGALTAKQISVNVYDENYDGSIKIIKQDSDGKPMSNVTFKIKGTVTGEEYTAVTDKNGEVTWKELLPQEYEVTEIKTAEGKSLLKEKITITLPLEVGEDELTDDLDVSNAVWDETSGKYCFYDLTYEVTNHAKLVMPQAGGFSHKKALMFGVGAAVVAIGFLSMRRRRGGVAKINF